VLKPQVEFHTKRYARVRQTGKIIGLDTRVIITYHLGNSTIDDFEYQKEATDFIKNKFGEYKDERYEIVNQYKKYGDRGYHW